MAQSRGPIIVVAHDPAWPQIYATVADRIREALGTRVLDLDHIGSTSVPGLPAKPVIDIDLTVADSSDEPAYVPALEAAGFRFVLCESGWHEHRLLTHDDPRYQPARLLTRLPRSDTAPDVPRLADREP